MHHIGFADSTLSYIFFLMSTKWGTVFESFVLSNMIWKWLKFLQAWDVLPRFFPQTNPYNVIIVEFNMLKNGPEIQIFDSFELAHQSCTAIARWLMLSEENFVAQWLSKNMSTNL
jgi:hypothetical protein